MTTKEDVMLMGPDDLLKFINNKFGALILPASDNAYRFSPFIARAYGLETGKDEANSDEILAWLKVKSDTAHLEFLRILCFMFTLTNQARTDGRIDEKGNLIEDGKSI
jgi:hypothetical protein